MTLINATTNFRERKVSVNRAITILAKNNIEVNEDEAAAILDFLYHIAISFHKHDSVKRGLNLTETSNQEKKLLAIP